MSGGVSRERIGEGATFYHPDRLVAQAIEARRAKTGTGFVHESAVPKECALSDAAKTLSEHSISLKREKRKRFHREMRERLGLPESEALR